MLIHEIELERIAFNFSGNTQRKKLNGKEYIVAPMSLIVPGVLNGSKGSLYYPLDEIKKSRSAWNHIPIVLDHPTHNGMAISARTPEILERQSLGVILNATVEGGLTAEGWFDIEKTRQVSPEILNRLETGQKIELSTGLGGDEEQTEGTTNSGHSYRAIYRNYRPDHLAVFVDKVGACSINDGCGVNNDEGVENGGTLVGETVMPVGFSEIDGHIHQIKVNTDGFGIAEETNGHEHKIKNFKVLPSRGHTHILVQEKLEPPRIITRQSGHEKTETTNKETDMNKKELVTDLIENCSCWNEDDSDSLNEFSVEKLKTLNKAAKQSKTDSETLAENETTLAENKEKIEEQELVINEVKSKLDPKKEEDEKPTENEEKTEMKFEDFPTDVQNDLKHYRSLRERDKQQLIDRLTENLKDEDKESMVENLKGKEIEDLQPLLKLLPEEKREIESEVYNYSGMGHVSSEVENTVLAPAGGGIGLPSWDY